MSDKWQYAIAFLFGAVVIAVFAYRQLESLTSKFPRAQGIVLKLATASLLGGRRSFRKAYICYLLVLETLYVIACTVQPIIGVIFEGAAPKDELFRSPEWPLAASLLIVGFSPNFPLVVQLEQAFRRLSHKFAGIPEYLFAIIDEIEDYSFPEQSSNRSLREFFDRAKESGRLAPVYGLTLSETQAFRKDVLTILLFDYWIFSRVGDEIWSQELRSRFSDLEDYLVPRVEALKSELSLLFAECRKSEFLKGFEAQINPEETDAAAYNVKLAKFFGDHKDKEHHLNEEMTHAVTWLNKLAGEASILASQMQALMGLLIVNDRAPRAARHPEFSVFLKHALAAKPRTVWNAVLLGLLLGFIAVVIATAVVRLARLYQASEVGVATLEQVAPALAQASALSGFGCLIMFGVSAAVVLFLRMSKIEAGTWTFYSPQDQDYPVTQYISLLLSASILAGIVNLTYYLIYQYLTAPDQEFLVESFIRTQTVPRMLYAVSGGIFGCFLALVLDEWDKGQLARRNAYLMVVLFCIIITMYGAVELLMFGSLRIIMIEAVGLFVFTSVALGTVVAFLKRVPAPSRLQSLSPGDIASRDAATAA